MTVLQNLSIAKLQEGYKNKDFSVREVVDFFIERIEKHDNKINSFTKLSTANLLILLVEVNTTW